MICTICGEEIQPYALAYYSTYDNIFYVCRWCLEKLPISEVTAYECKFARIQREKATLEKDKDI